MIDVMEDAIIREKKLLEEKELLKINNMILESEVNTALLFNRGLEYFELSRPAEPSKEKVVPMGISASGHIYYERVKDLKYAK